MNDEPRTHMYFLGQWNGKQGIYLEWPNVFIRYSNLLFKYGLFLCSWSIDGILITNLQYSLLGWLYFSMHMQCSKTLKGKLDFPYILKGNSTIELYSNLDCIQTTVVCSCRLVCTCNENNFRSSWISLYALRWANMFHLLHTSQYNGV